MKAIIFDWDGTIAKVEVANLAAHRRALSLGIDDSLDDIKLKQKDHSHYNDAKKAIKKIYDLDNNVLVTEKMTEIFKKYYIEVVDENTEIFYQGMKSVLLKLKDKYELIIATTLRQDIIESVLKKLDFEIFTSIYGNTPSLSHSKERLVKKACKDYECIAIVGDREEDILAGKMYNLKTVSVAWGQSTAKDANNHISNSIELLNIF